MATDKLRVPTDEEQRIIERNGIDMTKVSMGVAYRTDDLICLKAYKTGDEITIRQGDKKWESY